MPAGAALLAVGGYGRGELFPHSDVDVLVLLPPSHTGSSEALKTSIEAFITACWDIGLEIGSSVRTVAECIALAESDLTVQVTQAANTLVRKPRPRPISARPFESASRLAISAARRSG